jgi:hypothetical protein
MIDNHIHVNVRCACHIFGLVVQDRIGDAMEAVLEKLNGESS